MTHFRFAPLAFSLAGAIALAACNTAPTMMPASTASASSMGTSDQMAKMDAQMKSMQAMHDKMMNAKTPEERSKLMAEHMKTMRDGMTMMEGMSGTGMKGMKGMKDMKDMKDMQGMSGDIGAHQQMLEKRMDMMQSMMKMMMDQMPAGTAK